MQRSGLEVSIKCLYTLSYRKYEVIKAMELEDITQGESDEKEDEKEKRTQIEPWSTLIISSGQEVTRKEPVRQKQTSIVLETEPVANYIES